jgi:hypothetical protein
VGLIVQALPESQSKLEDGSQEKLRSIQILKSESVTSYLGIFTQTRDELATVGEIVDPDFLVRIALNDFSKPWGSFVRGILDREVMPN